MFLIGFFFGAVAMFLGLCIYSTIKMFDDDYIDDQRYKINKLWRKRFDDSERNW